MSAVPPFPPFPPSPQPAAADPEPQPPLRVLYVEDNPVTADLLRQLLAGEPDLLLRVVPSGAQALTIAQRWPVDALVLDKQLPDISGPELLTQLRALPGLARVPAWLCSADAGPDELPRALAAGFDGYWSKTELASEALDALLALSEARRHR